MGLIKKLLSTIFRVERIEPDPLSRSYHNAFRITRAPFLFYRCDNVRAAAGHLRLFSSRSGKGWSIYLYQQMTPDWALEREWHFGLFTIYHTGAGYSTREPGWAIAWGRLNISFDRPSIHRKMREREDRESRRRVAKARAEAASRKERP